MRATLHVLFVLLVGSLAVLWPRISRELAAHAHEPAEPVAAEAAGPLLFGPELAPYRVARLRWNHGASAAENVAQIVRGRAPVVIEDAPVLQEWAAFSRYRRWPLRDDQQQQQQPRDNFLLHNVRSSDERLFCPSQRREGQMPVGSTLRSHFTTHNITLAEFLRRADTSERRRDAREHAAAEGRQYVYFSGALAPDRMAEVAPASMLRVHEQGLLGDEGGAVASASQADAYLVESVWLAEDGVVANMHYDRSHNFAVQITGAKNWTLFAPWNAPSLYVYPALHPHYHSTQVDLMNGDALRYFPRLSSAKGATVEVRAGEVLYVPPFYFHTVQSLGFSVMASVVSPSLEESVCARLLFQRPEPAASWPLELRARAALWFLQRLHERFEQLFGRARPPAAPFTALGGFLSRTVWHRFQRLRTPELLAFTSPEMQAALRDAADGSCDIASAPAAVSDASRQQLEAHLHGAAQLLEDFLARMRHAEQWARAVSEICVGNLIEHALAAAVGPENVLALLTCALTFRGSPLPTAELLNA